MRSRWPLPQSITVSFSLPQMNNALKTSEAAGNVLTAVSEGEPTPIKASRLMVLIDSYRRAWELTDIEERCGIWEQIRSAIPTPTQRLNQCLIIQDFVGTLFVLVTVYIVISIHLANSEEKRNV